VEWVPEKAIFRSVTVYNTNLSSQCNLLAQIEQVQDGSRTIAPRQLPPDNSLPRTIAPGQLRLMIFQLSLITLQNWSSKKNYKKEFD
jgi:hypothetical protein